VRFGWQAVVVLSVAVGMCVAFASGLVENTPGGVAIPEKRHYGYPLVWRTFDPFVGESYLPLEFLADCAVWVAVALVVAVPIFKLRKR